MKIWELTEILLIVLLHLDSIHFYQTERQSLRCWEIAQAKQYLSAILTTKRHEKSDKKDNQHWMKGFSDFPSIGFLTFLSKTRGQWEENLTGSSTVCFASLEIFRVDGKIFKTLSSCTFNVMVALPISTEPQCLSWSITASTTEISWEAIYWIIKSLEAAVDIITFMSDFWISVTNVWL